MASIHWYPVSIGSGYGLLPGRLQAITQTNADLFTEPLGTNFTQIWVQIQALSSKKIHL